MLEEELAGKQGSKMNKASRRILEEREIRMKMAKEDTPQETPVAVTKPQSVHKPAKKPAEPKRPEPTTDSTFAPKINKVPDNIAAQRQNKRIEELLYDDARRKKEKQAELER